MAFLSKILFQTNKVLEIFFFLLSLYLRCLFEVKNNNLMLSQSLQRTEAQINCHSFLSAL